jgi:hypothetical protein
MQVYQRWRFSEDFAIEMRVMPAIFSRNDTIGVRGRLDLFDDFFDELLP